MPKVKPKNFKIFTTEVTDIMNLTTLYYIITNLLLSKYK